jgi:hypothetical protein
MAFHCTSRRGRIQVLGMLPGVVCMPNAQLRCLQNAILCREHSFTDGGQDTKGEELWLSRKMVHHVTKFSSLDRMSVPIGMSMQEKCARLRNVCANAWQMVCLKFGDPSRRSILKIHPKSCFRVCPSRGQLQDIQPRHNDWGQRLIKP